MQSNFHLFGFRYNCFLPQCNFSLLRSSLLPFLFPRFLYCTYIIHHNSTNVNTFFKTFLIFSKKYRKHFCSRYHCVIALVKSFQVPYRYLLDCLLVFLRVCPLFPRLSYSGKAILIRPLFQARHGQRHLLCDYTALLHQ